MQPCFSLILPVYNVEKYLDRCMRSILEQDFRDYEVILVDDGSPDSCPALCDAYAAEDDRVRVIHKVNGGLSSARNAGLDAARGKYIWFIDSDDWIEEGSLRRLYDASCEGKIDILKFNHYRIDESRETVRCNVAPGLYEGKDGIAALVKTAFCAGGKYVLSAWSHIYCREMLVKNNALFISERKIGSEDYLFNLSLLPQVKILLVLEDALYNYDKRDGSITQKYRPNLAEQYNCLYAHLLRAYKTMGLDGKYESLIHRFYVWHLIMGTCLPHEYCRITETHSLADGRRNIRRILASKELRHAVRKSSRKKLPLKKKLQLLALALRFEPLFYHLFVIKPGRRAGEQIPSLCL